jgi:hypothetical protein
VADDHGKFNLRYVGDRFEGGRLPVEVLLDLPAFRDLVVSFAKVVWKEGNPERQRIPKGFDKSFSFDLVGVTSGSAIPALEWRVNNEQERLPTFGNPLSMTLQDGFKRFVQMVAAADNNDAGNVLTSEQIHALNRLGSGLKEGERIEFLESAGPQGNVVYLDFARRRKLITDARETYQVRYEAIGRLAANDTKGSITIHTFEYGDILIPVDPVAVFEEFDGNLGYDVQFDLRIELDHKDAFRSVVEIYELTVIEEKVSEAIAACRNRLDSMLSKGVEIAGGELEPVSKIAVDLACGFLKRRPNLSSKYRFYPSDGGAVLLEFETNAWDLSVVFLQDGAVELFGISLLGGDDLQPQSFTGVGDDFLAKFDERVNAT